MTFEFKEKIKYYLSDFRFLWALCLIINIITFLFIFYKIHPGDKSLALHYNVLIGVEWYGKGKNLYFIPGIGLLITFANFIIYRALKNSNFFYNFLTIFVSMCAQLILLVSAMLLVKVN